MVFTWTGRSRPKTSGATCGRNSGATRCMAENMPYTAPTTNQTAPATMKASEALCGLRIRLIIDFS